MPYCYQCGKEIHWNSYYGYYECADCGIYFTVQRKTVGNR